MDYPYLTVLAEYINTRWSVYMRKEVHGLPAPWSTNRLINEYRFCNVHRENDRVTRWLRTYWYTPNEHDPHLWLRAWLARMINWPPSLGFLGYPEVWDINRIYEQLDVWRVENKLFTGAYIVSTNGRKMDKLEYVCHIADKAAREWNNTTPVMMSLEDTHEALTSIEGIGSFMAAQIVADLKHTRQLTPAVAKDWWDWAAPGPGSMRGLNRLMNRPLTGKWRGDAFVEELLRLREALEPDIEWVPDLCLQDLQNNLCEFDKYMRLTNGGQVRAKYAPHTYPM